MLAVWSLNLKEDCGTSTSSLWTSIRFIQVLFKNTTSILQLSTGTRTRMYVFRGKFEAGRLIKSSPKKRKSQMFLPAMYLKVFYPVLLRLSSTGVVKSRPL